MFQHKWLVLILILLTFFAVTSDAQKPQVADCVSGSTGQCRPLGIRQVSGTNAANTVTINAPNIMQILVINGVCSAGTAALTVSAGVDMTNYLTIDTVAAAATQTKQYLPSTVGAGIALSPLGFQWVQVSMATCGAGNTSTLTVGVKGI